MVFLLYFLKVVICSGVLVGYYWLFLRNKRFHHYNRFFLLGTLVLSLVLPLFRIPVFNEESGTLNQVVYRTAQVVTVSPSISAASPAQETSNLFVPGNLVWALYGVGTLILLITLCRSLGNIRKISRLYPFERVNDLKFYQTQEPGTPFSFLRSIFWNEGLNFNSQQGQQIFRHELFHVQQNHSVDILLAETITMLCWFNPFFYLIKKELKAIHEFLADQYAASSSNRYQYAELLVEQVMASRAASLAHPFFQHQLKRRITMITQLNQTKYGYWSRVMVLPLSVTLFFSLTLYAGENKEVPTSKQDAEVQVNPDMSNTGNFVSVADTVPKAEQHVQKWKEAQLAEKQALEEKQLQFLYEKAKQRDLEVVREKQLLLQKMLQENRAKNEDLNAVLQKELNSLRVQEKHLQELRVTQDFVYKNEDRPLYKGELKDVLHKSDDRVLYKDNVQDTVYKNDTRDFLYRENQILSNDLNKLLLLKKELEAGNDAQKEERLKEIDRLLKALPGIRQQDIAVQPDAGYRADTTIRTLQRFFNKNFRYPKDMIENNGQGSVWYSFKLDESGKPVDFEVYNTSPAAVDGKIWEIVIVGYSKQTGNTINAENLQQQMKNEILRIAAKNGNPFREGTKFTPARYYFKATFKLQKED